MSPEERSLSPVVSLMSLEMISMLPKVRLRSITPEVRSIKPEMTGETNTAQAKIFVLEVRLTRV